MNSIFSAWHMTRPGVVLSAQGIFRERTDAIWFGSGTRYGGGTGRGSGGYANGDGMSFVRTHGLDEFSASDFQLW
jgi:hypothetical protein